MPDKNNILSEIPLILERYEVKLFANTNKSRNDSIEAAIILIIFRIGIFLRYCCHVYLLGVKLGRVTFYFDAATTSPRKTEAAQGNRTLPRSPPHRTPAIPHPSRGSTAL